MLLALDFGGTKLAAAVLDRHTRRWLAHGRFPNPSTEDAGAVLSRMIALADEQLAVAGTMPRAVGISFNGPVDIERGCPRVCYHISGWQGFPIRERIANRYGVPTVLENDATAAALGEWCYGAGRATRNMLYITVSTGIGGGLVLDGALYRGKNGLAGEIGHMCIEPDGPLCACGRRGCLEALAAGPALARQYHKALVSFPHVPSTLRGQEHITGKDVGTAANQGDVLACRALQGAARPLGVAIGNVLNLLNLERVILGGGVTSAGPAYLSWVRRAAHETAIDGVAVDIVLAELGDDAPLWGACVLAEEICAH